MLSCCSTTAIRILFVCIFDVYYVMSSEVITLLSFNKSFSSCFKSLNGKTKKKKKRLNSYLLHLSFYVESSLC